MQRNQLVLGFTLVSLIFSLAICWQQSAIAKGVTNAAESLVGASQTPKPPAQNSKSTIDKRKSEIENTAPEANNLSPRLSFEKTVCDLGDVGQGTKNTCEFKFTNTGQTLLKIKKINQICLPR